MNKNSSEYIKRFNKYLLRYCAFPIKPKDQHREFEETPFNVNAFLKRCEIRKKMGKEINKCI